MSPEDKKMYEDFFDMFATPGWKRLEEKAKELIVTINDVHNIKDLESLHYTRGRIVELHTIVTLKETMERFHAYQLENDDDSV